MTHRRLTLHAERLADLTTDELAAVVGGAPTKDCPDDTYYCVTGPAICARLTRVTCP